MCRRSAVCAQRPLIPSHTYVCSVRNSVSRATRLFTSSAVLRTNHIGCLLVGVLVVCSPPAVRNQRSILAGACWTSRRLSCFYLLNENNGRSRYLHGSEPTPFDSEFVEYACQE